MRRFHRVIALVLAALWLPAVWHCGLETLGAAEEERECCSHDVEGAEASEGACVADHCGVFDDGHFRIDDETSAMVTPPALMPGVVLDLWRAGEISVARAEPSSPPEPPAGLSRRWMFELRTAPLANAPGWMAG